MTDRMVVIQVDVLPRRALPFPTVTIRIDKSDQNSQLYRIAANKGPPPLSPPPQQDRAAKMTKDKDPMTPALHRAATAQPPSFDEPPLHDARDLTGDRGAARIVLDGAVYTLRITRAGKLILTK